MDKYTLREVADLTLFNFATNKYFTHIDYAQASTNEWNSETTKVTGGRNLPVRIVLEGQKQGSLKLTTKLFSMKDLAMLAGTELQTGADIFKVENIVVTSNKVSASKDIVADTLTVINIDTDEELTKGDPSDAKQYSLDGKDVTVSADLEGKSIRLIYQWNSPTAQRVVITSDKFPGFFKLVGDAYIVNENKGVESFQSIFYKAKLQSGFTLNFQGEGDPTTLELNFDLMPGKDGKTMAEYIEYTD